MADITNKLQELTKDLLTEESLTEITSAFNSAVDEKVLIHVEKALTEQDEDHAEKVQTLLEAIDTDHTSKLERLVEAIDGNHLDKLKNVIAKYEHVLGEEANGLRGDLIGNISNYLDLYLDKNVPSDSINEAVQNKKANHLIDELRKTLAVDMAVASDSIKAAIVDGKTQIDEASVKVQQLAEQNNKLSTELAYVKSELALEHKTIGMDEDKKRHMTKLMKNKTHKFIIENFDYAAGLFDKTEEENLDVLKTQATKSVVDNAADRPEEEVISESVTGQGQEDGSSDFEAPYRTSYMDELNKW